MAKVCRRVPLALAALLLGCASGPSTLPAPASPPAAPVRPRTEAVSVSTVTAAEAHALHAAIVASLRPALPTPEAEPKAPEPIEPLIREGPEAAPSAETTTARLPPESIRRIVHQSAGRFRACYERALLENPASAGRVVVRFVIAPDGRVARAEELSASLESPNARRCVLQSFFDLVFSNPGQTVSVDYPMTFARGDGQSPDELPSARRAAGPPPPGFAEAMRRGQPVTPPPRVGQPFVPRFRDVRS
jgi:hypothetical protein